MARKLWKLKTAQKNILMSFVILLSFILLAITGLFITTSADDYDTQDEGTLTKIGEMPYKCEGASLFYNHSIYNFAVWNRTATGKAGDEIWRYFPEAYDGHAQNETITICHSGKATQLVTLDTTKKHFDNDCIWMLGGRDSGDSFTNIVDTIYCFSLNNNTVWDTGHTLAGVVSGSLGAIDDNGVVYSFGGTDGSAMNEIYAYNYSNGTSWLYDTLSQTRYKHGVAFAYGQEAILIGGENQNSIRGYNISDKSDFAITTYTSCSKFEGIQTNCVWVPQMNSVVIVGGREVGCGLYIDNITIYNHSDNSIRVVNNYTSVIQTAGVCYGHNATNYLIYIVGGFVGTNSTKDVYQFDLGIAYEEEEEETTSSYSIKGLEGTNYNVTWTGNVGETVWSNVTNPGGTLELNMSINTTENVSEIRIYCDNLDASIPASNITVYVSRNNSSAYFAVPNHNPSGEGNGKFPDGGGNVTINETTWQAGSGTNPFTGAGLTNISTSLYFRFTLDLGSVAGTYNQSDWMIYIGRNE